MSDSHFKPRVPTCGVLVLTTEQWGHLAPACSFCSVNLICCSDLPWPFLFRSSFSVPLMPLPQHPTPFVSFLALLAFIHCSTRFLGGGLQNKSLSLLKQKQFTKIQTRARLFSRPCSTSCLSAVDIPRTDFSF